MAYRGEEQLLPHNLEAERSVLGAALLHGDAFHVAAENLEAEDFFRDAHRRIWTALATLSEGGVTLDLVTLKEELTRTGELGDVGGPTYIAALVDGVPRSMNVEHYATIIIEKSKLRQTIFAANKLIASAYEAERPAADLVGEASDEFDILATKKDQHRPESLRALMNPAMEAIELANRTQQAVSGVPTGLRDLDEMTTGFHPGDFVILAARPSMGKTSLAMNIATHAGAAGVTTLVFSLEMTKDQLMMRMLCGEARIDSHRMRSGFLGEKDWASLAQSLGTLAELPVYVDDTPSVTLAQIRSKTRALRSEKPVGLIIIDYIQLMRPPRSRDNRTQEVGEVSRGIKAMAKHLNVPIIALSQLTRNASGQRPKLADLRESGDLEQDADIVLFIHRDDRPGETDSAGIVGVTEVIIGKQRNGPVGVVKLAFIREFMRFENLAPENL